MLEQLGHLGTVYTGDLHDGEVIYHEAGDGPVELIEFDVISASDDQIEVVAKVRAPIAFDVHRRHAGRAWMRVCDRCRHRRSGTCPD